MSDVTLTREQADGLIKFLSDQRHAGHVDGRGCIIGAAFSCNACVAIDAQVALLTRAQQEPAPAAHANVDDNMSLATAEALAIVTQTVTRQVRRGELPKMASDLMPDEAHRRLADSIMCRCGKDGCWACGVLLDPGPLAHFCARHAAEPGEYLPCLPIKHAPATPPATPWYCGADTRFKPGGPQKCCPDCDHREHPENWFCQGCGCHGGPDADWKPQPATPPACGCAEVLRHWLVHDNGNKDSRDDCAKFYRRTDACSCGLDAALSRCAGTGEWECVVDDQAQGIDVQDDGIMFHKDGQWETHSWREGDRVRVYRRRSKAGERRG